MNEKRIVVASDFSEVSDEAIRQADSWARADSARLVVCHALPDLVNVNPVFTGRTGGQLDEFISLQGLVLEKLAERVIALTGREAADFDVVVQSGRADAVLLQEAEVPGTSMLVLGNRGISGLERMLLGSVADRVVRYAPIPVLIVRPSTGSNRVVAATDFSDSSLPAITMAASQARARGAALTVMHCLEVAPDPFVAFGVPFGGVLGGPRETDVAQMKSVALETLRAATEKRCTDVELVVEIGDPAVAVVRLAERERAALVVVGTRGRTGLARLLLGSVAKKIIKHAPCSVLVVRLQD